MPKYVHLDRVLALIDVALASGGRRLTAMSVDWDISGDCTDSFQMELYGRADIDKVGDGRWQTIRPMIQNTPQRLFIHTRCRRCVRCLRMRARRWYGATMVEVKASTRTWFGTLTLSPANQFRALSQARAKLGAQSTDFDALTEHEQFVARHVAIGTELTKYIKRVRKNSGAKFRYLLIAEKHKSGDPHYHMLVHERPLGGVVPHRILSKAYQLGFEKWRLIDPHDPKDNPGYLCKYLSKSLSARVRASQGYGGVSNDLHAYVCQALQRLREGGGPNEREETASIIDPLFASLYGLD